MPLYEYTGYTSAGKSVSGVIDADDQGNAKLYLKEKEVFLSEPLKESRKKYISLINRFKLSVRPQHKELSSFTYQLRTLLISGLPVVDALTILVNEEKNRRFKGVLADVRDKVKDGDSIAAALSNHPDIFSGLYVNVVAAGDAGGMLEDALNHLSVHLERQENIFKKVRAAMTYPIFMSLIGIIILFYLLTSAVPRVVIVFHDVGRALPMPTVLLIRISEFLSSYWTFIFMLLAAIIYSIYRFSKRPRGRELLERFLDSIPYIGGTLQSLHIARFGRTMEALLNGGVPLAKALAITSKAAGNMKMEKILSDAEKDIIEGKSLSGSLRDSDIFPESILSLIAVGEAGGNLEDIFAKVGDAKEKELDSKLNVLLTLLEPIMILFMGLIVGFIVLAILLPIFEMSQITF